MVGGMCVAGVACMVGVVAGGMHSREHAWQRACMAGGMHAGEMATASDITHPTGMHSCLFMHPNIFSHRPQL